MKLPMFSHTRWSDHAMCPLMYKLKSIDYACGACKKGPIPKNSKECPFCKIELVKPLPLERGSKFSEEIEKYLLGGDNEAWVRSFIKNDKAFIAAKQLRNARLANPAEIQVEVSKLIHPTDKPYSMLGKMDVVTLDYTEFTAQVIDWKTGSVGKRGGLKAGSSAKYDTQLELYAFLTMMNHPEILEVSTHLYFVDANDVGRTDRETYTRSQLVKLAQIWIERADKWAEDHLKENFQFSSGYWCNWCSFTFEKGGPCTVKTKKEEVNYGEAKG